MQNSSLRSQDVKFSKCFHSTDVDQFLGSIKATFGSLLERYTGAEINEKLGNSILATVFRQLVLHSDFMTLNCLFAIYEAHCANSNPNCCGPGR